MIALDTNVLVRLLVSDPNEELQNKAAKRLLKGSGQVFIPQIVQVETVWVLESAYGFDKTSVIKVLTHLHTHPIFSLQHAESFKQALNTYQNHNADFSDCLILAGCNNKKYQLATFDRKLSKLDGVVKVSS
jgi:predicted nucleic-acid-binding protein